MSNGVSPMNIVMLMDIPFDSGSYLGRYQPLALYLARKGHKITILMPNHDPKKEGYYLEDSDNVFIYETGIPFFKKVYEGRKNYSTFILFKIGLQNIIHSIRLLSRLKFDLMLVCKPLPIAATVALLFKVFKGKKLILDCDDAEVAINSVRSNLQRKLVQGFENVLPRFSDVILVNTDFTFQRNLNRGVAESRLVYIPNGIDVERFSNISSESLAEIEKKDGGKVVLYFGDFNFTSGHNVDILLHAFRTLLSELPSARLWLIGDGSDEGNLRKLAGQLGINKSIYWGGRVSPERMPGYISACDVVVDPIRNTLSNMARCPIKIIEAMYLGKPVVTSDIGERKRLLGEFGFYAKEGDAQSLSEKIFLALESSQFKNQRNLVVQRSLDYSWDKLSLRVENVLRELVRK